MRVRKVRRESCEFFPISPTKYFRNHNFLRRQPLSQAHHPSRRTLRNAHHPDIGIVSGGQGNENRPSIRRQAQAVSRTETALIQTLAAAISGDCMEPATAIPADV